MEPTDFKTLTSSKGAVKTMLDSYLLPRGSTLRFGQYILPNTIRQKICSAIRRLRGIEGSDETLPQQGICHDVLVTFSPRESHITNLPKNFTFSMYVFLVNDNERQLTAIQVRDALLDILRSVTLKPRRIAITPLTLADKPTNELLLAETQYNDLTRNWETTHGKNKELFESFGVEVAREERVLVSRVQLGPQGKMTLTRSHYEAPLQEGMYARLFVVLYAADHVVGGFITNTHVVVLHQYLSDRYTVLEQPFREFVEKELSKTYVVHPPATSTKYNIQSTDSTVQGRGACQRWYAMLPYTIAKYMASDKPIAEQTPEQRETTAENWSKIGDWNSVKPVYDLIQKNPLKCWGGIVQENKLIGIGRRKTRRDRKRRSTRRR
jgi:hypothetical protein